MKYVFYADIFMVINFFMDYFLLSITGKLLKKNTHTTSYLLGAFVGAAGITIMIATSFSGTIVGNVFAYIVLSFIMCMVTFAEKEIKGNLKCWGVFYVVSFMLGGMMNAMYFYYRNLLCFSVLAILSYILLNRGVDYMKIVMGRTGQREDILNVELRHHEKSICVRALFDSGNSLSEPISGKPVHIISYEIANTILEGGKETQDKIRLIPYHSLGKSSGILTAFECEEMIVEIKGSKVNIGPAYLGIYRGALSTGKKYKMILNRSIDKWL